MNCKVPNFDKYQVGYAIRNVNPWINNDPAKGFYSGMFIMPGNEATNPKYTANRLFDDNGDGVVDEHDGVFVTATAITDSKKNTVLFITLDFLRGYSEVVNPAKISIVSALGSNVISEDRIYFCANHTHSGPPIDTLEEGNDDQKAYFNWIIQQIKEAAVDAYNDRAPAEMFRGTVNAKEATAALGYNGGKGYQMNAVRHYEVTMTETISDGETSVVKYLTGSGGKPTTRGVVSTMEYRPVEKPDNNMHVLLFTFPDDATKKPVVFVNWRAHSTMSSGAIPDALSSDYANGLRTALGNVKSVVAPNGYRAAFFQGACGNTVPCARNKVWPTMPETKDWLEYVENVYKTDDAVKAQKTFVYGSMLADVAKYCIENSGKMRECPAGEIRTMQVTWHGELQKDHAGLQEAALHTKELQAEGTAFKYPHTYNGYTVNSGHHRNHILWRKDATSSFTQMELNAILLGDYAAFVTAPNELSDKFYDYSSGEKYSDDKNDWNKLNDNDTYGTPFVLGYTNGHFGYVGNWLHYTANTPTYYDITGYAENGQVYFGAGTYESNSCRFAQGQGEALVEKFNAMLNHLRTK